MPTYQYACTNPETKHQFEVVQSFTDPAVATCPECGAPVRKVYGSVGVVFKGSGFYRTDSRDSASKKTASSANGKDGGSSGEKSADKSSGEKSSSSSGSDSSSSSSSKPAASSTPSSGSSSSGSTGGSTAG